MQLFNSTQALKEHWNKQRKRGLGSPELFCSELPVNAPRWVGLQKTNACQGRLRGCLPVKTRLKTASKASIGEQWQRMQPDEFISDRRRKRRGAQKGEREGGKEGRRRTAASRSDSEGLVREGVLGNQSQRQKERCNVNNGQMRSRVGCRRFVSRKY